jgi:hypothetical protein
MGKKYLMQFEQTSEYEGYINGSGATLPNTSICDDTPNIPYFSPEEENPTVVEAVQNDVNFYDFDGKRIASYTIEQAKQLTQLPTPPAHKGLVFQEWNWNLSDIQTYDRQYIDVGANYTTDDGKTHMFVEIDSDEYEFKFGFNTSVRFFLSFDWGDGSEPTRLYYGGNVSHIYEKAGSYDLTITPENPPSNATYGIVFAYYSGFNYCQKTIREIHLGYNCNRIYLTQAKAIVSIPKCTLDGNNSSFHESTIPMVVIPRDTKLITQTNFAYNFNGEMSFPRQISGMTGTRVIQASTMNRVVLPETIDGGLVKDFATLIYCRIFSIPLTFKTENTATFTSSPNLEYIDISQGWVPTINLNLSSSVAWTRDNIVKFLNKLGTTENSITLTFGATNLAKLSDADKAIATNKGYTLA